MKYRAKTDQLGTMVSKNDMWWVSWGFFFLLEPRLVTKKPATQKLYWLQAKPQEKIAVSSKGPGKGHPLKTKLLDSNHSPPAKSQRKNCDPFCTYASNDEWGAYSPSQGYKEVTQQPWEVVSQGAKSPLQPVTRILCNVNENIWEAWTSLPSLYPMG